MGQPERDTSSLMECITSERLANEQEWLYEWRSVLSIATGGMYPEYSRAELRDFVGSQDVASLLAGSGPRRMRDKLLKSAAPLLASTVGVLRQMFHGSISGGTPFWNAPTWFSNDFEDYDDGMICVYSDWIWHIDAKTLRIHTKDSVLDLFNLDIDRLRSKLEKARRVTLATSSGERPYRRDPIPEEVRMFVWRRDVGKCVQCGSQDRLEYDHVIPVSKGGSNTSRNLQLLCEVCNRLKRDNV